jgi:putative nucleotidyltransferase with HDIG domain
MSRIEVLEVKVGELYQRRDPERSDWADWLGTNHVPMVADNASKLAQRFSANEEYCRAAALLHDIADTKMKRFDGRHEASSLQIARELLLVCEYSAREIELIVDDAVRLHSCYYGKVPQSVEGKILATADSLAHLQTDFYLFAMWAMAGGKSLEDIKAWALKKIARDYNDKILFDIVRSEVKTDYEMLTTLYSR